MPNQLSARFSGFALLRLAIALIFLTHSITRFSLGPDGFGEFLSAKGFPFGRALAWGITIFEFIAAPLLAIGIATRWIATILIVELAFGIVLVHFPEGWFVVGAGRNGYEYSFLLIMSLLAILTGEGKEKTL